CGGTRRKARGAEGRRALRAAGGGPGRPGVRRGAARLRGPRRGRGRSRGSPCPRQGGRRGSAARVGRGVPRWGAWGTVTPVPDPHRAARPGRCQARRGRRGGATYEGPPGAVRGGPSTAGRTKKAVS
ncbi:MAG: hypothetical protein AVDCRST_MAG11-2035, partial [uncultured Gemmatimonadaceae bacterium]